MRGFRELRDRLRRCAVGKAGDDAVAALADEMRAFAHQHPALYAATVPSGEDAVPAIRARRDEALEVVLAVIAGYGIAEHERIHAARSSGVPSTLHDLEIRSGFGIPVDLDASFDALVAHLTQAMGEW